MTLTHLSILLRLVLQKTEQIAAEPTQAQSLTYVVLTNVPYAKRQPSFSVIAIGYRGYGEPLINTPALDNLQVLHGQLGKLLIVR